MQKGGLRLEPVGESDGGGYGSTARRASSYSRTEATRTPGPTTSQRFSPDGSPDSRRARRRPSIGNEPLGHAASRMPLDMVLRLQHHEQDEQALRAAAVRELRAWFERQERRHCPTEVAKRALVATRFAGPDDLGAAYRWVAQHVDEIEDQAKEASSAWAPLWRWARELLEPWEPAPKLDRENYRLWATERVTQEFWGEFADETERWGGPWVVQYTLGLEDGDFSTDDQYAYPTLISQSGERRSADAQQQEREALEHCRLSELERRAINAGVDENAVELALQGSKPEAYDELINLLLAQADDDLRIELKTGDARENLVATLEKAYTDQLECTVLVAKHPQTGKERIISCEAKQPLRGNGAGQTGTSPAAHSPAGSLQREHSPIRSPQDSDDSGFLSPQQQEQQEQRFEDIEAEFHHVKSPEAKKAVVEWMVDSPVDEPGSRMERNYRLLQKCLVAWKLWVRQGRSVSTRLIVHRKQWRLWWRKRLGVHFHAWRETTRRRRRWQTTMGRVTVRWQQRNVASAFDAWLDYVSRKRKHSRLLDRSVRRMWQSRVAAAFCRWCEYTQQQRVKRRATLHMANRFPASFFTRWQKFTRYHKQLREEREAYEDAEAAQQSLHDWKRREKRKVRAEAYRKIYKEQLKKWHFDAMEDCFYAWRRWCDDRVRQKLRDEREETKRLKEQEKEGAEIATATIPTADAPGKMSSLLSTLTAPGSPKRSLVLEEDESNADSSEEDKRPATDRARWQSSPRRSPKKKRHGSPVRRPGRSPERRAPVGSSEDEDRWPPLDDEAFRSKSLRRRRMTKSRRRQQQQRRRSYDYDSHSTRRRHSGSGRSPSSPARAAQGRSRSRSGGSPKSGRRRPSGDGDVTTSDLDEETRLIKEVEEELEAANDALFKVETDKGSNFRRSGPRSPLSPVDRRTSPRSPKERRRKSSSPNTPHVSKGGEVSPRTLPMPPGQRHHYSDSELDSELDPVEVDRAKREISAEVELNAERELRRAKHELRQRRSPSPRRNEHGQGDQYTKVRDQPLEMRQQAAAERREQYAQDNGKVGVAGGGEGRLGLSGARGHDARFCCKVCNWTGSSHRAHNRANPKCGAVPVSIASAGKVSPGFGTGSRFGTYNLVSGDAATGNKFLHETKKDKEQRMLLEATRGSPQSYSRTLGLSQR